MSNELDRLIFGKNDTKHIVNVTVKDDNSVDVYRRIPSTGEIVKESVYYKPWALTPEKYKGSVTLKGSQYYKYLNPMSLRQYHYNRINYQRNTFLPRTPEEGFLILDGYSYYKDLDFNNLAILSTDIETLSLDPNDEDGGVVLIANTFRDHLGNISRQLFALDDYEDEHAMISDWCEYVKAMDPDIITGHNILSFDLEYLNTRLGSLSLGRDGTDMRVDEKESKFRKDSEQYIMYYNKFIAGREIVDTFFLSYKYDTGREFPSYGLKRIEKHLNLVDENRIEWDFQTNPVRKVLHEQGKLWEDFKEYCRTDADSPIKMLDIMCPAFFYMNRSIPKTFQQMINEATGSQLDTFMIRSYLQDGYSQPKTSQVYSYEGAISMGVPGFYKNVIKVDVASLYPSVMLNFDIHSKEKDPNRHLLKALDYFRTGRLEYKRLNKETGLKKYKDLDNSNKILINSLYGFLGTNYLLYNFPQGAEEVTRQGREILQKGVVWSTGHELKKVIKNIKNKGKETEEISYEWIVGDKVAEGRGYILTNCDTDSFSVTKGRDISDEEFTKEIEELNSIYPELIKWENDGKYKRFLVLAAKNYVMDDGKKIKFKGSSLKDSKKEPALGEMLKKLLMSIIDEKGEDDLVQIYEGYIREVNNIQDINRWTVKRTLSEAMSTSKRMNERKPMMAIEEAISKHIIDKVGQGDKFWTYNAVDGLIQDTDKDGNPIFYKRDGSPKMIPNQKLRFPQLWCGDQDVEHYIGRVYMVIEALEKVVDITKFIDYSSKKNHKLLLRLFENDTKGVKSV